jgi:uncharacterized protein
MTRSLGAPLDCSRVNIFETRVICRSGRLRALDRKLAQIESRLVLQTPEIIESHAEWLGKQRSCGDSTSCYAGLYESRIAALEKTGRASLAQPGTAGPAVAAPPAVSRLAPPEAVSDSPNSKATKVDLGPSSAVAVEADIWKSAAMDLAPNVQENGLSPGIALSAANSSPPVSDPCEPGACEVAPVQGSVISSSGGVMQSGPNTSSGLSGGEVAAIGGSLVFVIVAAIFLGKRFAFLKWLFWWPGYVVLFLQYFWPTEWGRGRDVAGGARRWRAREWVAPLYSLLIYGFLIFVFLPYLIARARG